MKTLRSYVRGKLEAGWLGVRRFTSEGTLELPAPR